MSISGTSLVVATNKKNCCQNKKFNKKEDKRLRQMWPKIEKFVSIKVKVLIRNFTVQFMKFDVVTYATDNFLLPHP